MSQKKEEEARGSAGHPSLRAQSRLRREGTRGLVLQPGRRPPRSPRQQLPGAPVLGAQPLHDPAAQTAHSASNHAFS